MDSSKKVKSKQLPLERPKKRKKNSQEFQEPQEIMSGNQGQVIEEGKQEHVKSLLLEKIKSKNVEAVKSLLENNKEVVAEIINQKVEGRITFLLLTVGFNDIETAKLLLEDGAEPELVDKSGKNCFHYAAKRGNLEMLKLLASYTKKSLVEVINAHDDFGLSVLHDAATGIVDSNIVKEFERKRKELEEMKNNEKIFFQEIIEGKKETIDKLNESTKKKLKDFLELKKQLKLAKESLIKEIGVEKIVEEAETKGGMTVEKKIGFLLEELIRKENYEWASIPPQRIVVKKKEDYRYNYEEILDALARLFTLDEVCTAVYMSKNGSQLFIASNEKKTVHAHRCMQCLSNYSKNPTDKNYFALLENTLKNICKLIVQHEDEQTLYFNRTLPSD
ncbi:62_t:CDS:2 [Ambispora gerdemannii]|uniref:62_t:CDS:1 n=1 Tax=Ambispora gerdemannii TaxID=144530 RepID=A0A9N9CEV7_9GLOM|nr:62_t:CDS:2 [Ambispora gerdemannii]